MDEAWKNMQFPDIPFGPQRFSHSLDAGHSSLHFAVFFVWESSNPKFTALRPPPGYSRFRTVLVPS